MPEPPASAAVTSIVTSPLMLELSAGEAIEAVGATASMLSACVFTVSGVPDEFQVRNLTVLAVVSVKAPVYWGEVVVGSVPSSVWRVTPTPEPPSAADSVTETGPRCQSGEQA